MKKSSGSDSVTENPGIEVVRFDNSQKVQKPSRGFLSRMRGGQWKGQDADGEESQTAFGSELLLTGKPSHAQNVHGKTEEASRETTFGSEILQLGHPTKYKVDGESLETSFGSEILQLGRPTQFKMDEKSRETSFGSEILQLGRPNGGARNPEGSNTTSFGTEILHMERPNPVEFQEGSNTTFGSEVLQKMRPIIEDGSETTFGSEVLQPLRAKRHNEAHSSGKSNNARFKVASSQANETGSESQRDSAKTSFGSEMLTKIPHPDPIAWEEGSTTTFGSELLQTLRAVYEQGSQTTFGSEMLQPIKIKAKHAKVEVDGSVTTFGSEQLIKSTIQQQVPGAATVKAGSRKVTFDTSSVQSRQSSIKPGMRAVDPAHLKMDSVYAWMSSYMPVEGATNPNDPAAAKARSAARADEDSASSGAVKEEFEVQLATKRSSTKKEIPPKTPALETPPDSGTRLRPQRTRKTKSRKRNMASQSSLDIPTVITEGDEMATDESSTGRKTSGHVRNLKSGNASKASHASLHPYEIREQTFKASPIATTDAFTSPGKITTEPLKDKDLSLPERLEKNGSQLSGYSTDNTTLAESVPIDATLSPLEKIPSDLVESRDDMSYEDSDAEASQSYADSSIPTAFQDMHDNDDISKASSTSSWIYNDVKLSNEPTMESGEDGRQRQTSLRGRAGRANFE
jgi:hypothetical protein